MRIGGGRRPDVGAAGAGVGERHPYAGPTGIVGVVGIEDELEAGAGVHQAVRGQFGHQQLDQLARVTGQVAEGFSGQSASHRDRLGHARQISFDPHAVVNLMLS